MIAFFVNENYWLHLIKFKWQANFFYPGLILITWSVISHPDFEIIAEDYLARRFGISDDSPFRPEISRVMKNYCSKVIEKWKEKGHYDKRCFTKYRGMWAFTQGCILLYASKWSTTFWKSANPESILVAIIWAEWKMDRFCLMSCRSKLHKYFM